MSSNHLLNGLVLPLIAEYHDGPKSNERRTRIRDLFIPLRVTPWGLRPVPVRLPVRRRVELKSAGTSRLGTTRTLDLERVELDIPVDDAGDVGRSVELSIETSIPELWWRFVGRVVQSEKHARRLVVRFNHSIGCETRRSTSADEA